MLDLHSANMLLHTVVGSVCLVAGCAALWLTKGSRGHIRAGWVFAWAMLPVVLTTIVAMLHQLLPLAIVMALAELYLIPSAILSFRPQAKGFVAANVALMLLAGAVGLFAGIQFLRINLGDAPFLLGPAVLSALFLGLAAQDWGLWRKRAAPRNFWVRRHLTRMVLAFTFAIMALVRIGLNFGLSLEASVLIPLGVALLVIVWLRRRYPVSRNAPAQHEELLSRSQG